MKITFGVNVENKVKPPLQIPGGYVKAPKLSDKQVKQINETRVLPEGYYLGAHKARGRGDSGYAMINIEKGNSLKWNNLGSYGSDNFYTPILPKGYEVENYKGKTYLKENGVSISKDKKARYLGWLAASLTAVLIGIGINLKK